MGNVIELGSHQLDGAAEGVEVKSRVESARKLMGGKDLYQMWRVHSEPRIGNEIEELELADLAEILADLLDLKLEQLGPRDSEDDCNTRNTRVYSAAFGIPNLGARLMRGLLQSTTDDEGFIEEFSGNLMRLICDVPGFDDSTHTVEYLKRLRRTYYFSEGEEKRRDAFNRQIEPCITGYKVSLAPLVLALNKAFVARSGSHAEITNDTFNAVVKSLFPELGDYLFPFRTLKGAVEELLRDYRKIDGDLQEDEIYTRINDHPGFTEERDIVEPQLKKFQERIKCLEQKLAEEGLGAEILNANILIPPVAEGGRLHFYGIQEVLTFIEDQLKYMEGYAERLCEKAITERAEKIRAAEKNVAALISDCTKLGGQGEGSIAAAREKAQKLNGLLDSVRDEITDGCEEVRVKRAPFVLKAKYLKEVCDLFHKAMALLEVVANGTDLKMSFVKGIEWQTTLQPRTMHPQLPEDKVKGEQCLKRLKGLEATLSKRKKEELDPAYHEASKRVEVLESLLNSLLSKLEGFLREIQDINVKGVSGNNIAATARSNARTFQFVVASLEVESEHQIEIIDSEVRGLREISGDHEAST